MRGFSPATGRRWAQHLAGSPAAMPALFTLSLLETLVLPVPIELVIIPWMLAQPHRLWRIAHVTLAGCIAGAAVGYAIGATLFESLGQWLLSTYGHVEAYEQFRGYFGRYGFTAVLAIGLLPIPFQTAILAAGATAYPLALFLVATAVSRGLRYYGLALLVHILGARALGLWQRRPTGTVVVLFIVVGTVIAARLALPL